RDVAIAERRDETEGIPDRVQNSEGSEIAIIVPAPAGGAPIPSLVGGDDVEPLRRERQHDLPPGVGKLRKAVEEQDQGPPHGLEAGLQHVYAQPVDIGHEAGTDAWAKNGTFQRGHLGLSRLPSFTNVRSPAADP